MAAAASAATAAAARIGASFSDASYFESGMVRVEDIRRLLDSRSLKDKLDAIKRVVALISLGRDAALFFPDVVKNVVAPSLDVKKLIYLYLVHYAEEKHDLALLSINSFQKDISDPNEPIRALALRVLSSVRVKVILQIVILAINKCAKDPSPYVRKAAAHTIAKVTSLDIPSRDLLIEPLRILLNDQSLEVLGSVVAVLDEVVPQKLHFIHPHFRHLCRSLPHMDYSSQVAVLRLLLRYGRTNFRKNAADPDLALLLESVRPILSSQHPSAVIAALSLLRHLSKKEDMIHNHTLLPLMRLILSSDPAVQYVALRTASHISLADPGALLPYLPELFVCAADGRSVKSAKIALLVRLCETAAKPSGIGASPTARKLLVAELRSYLYHSDKTLAAGASRAVGCLASAHPPSTAVVIGQLVSVVASSSSALVVAESVTVLRRLLQLHPETQARALPRLVSLLLIPRGEEKAIAASQARAAIVWLIGEFYDKVPHDVAPEALRLLARGFAQEEADVKLQILNLAAKVVAWGRKESRDDQLDSGLAPSAADTAVSSEVRVRLLDYVTSCALVDSDYDVRGKARMLRKLFVPGSTGGACAFSGDHALLSICGVLLRGGKPESSNVVDRKRDSAHLSPSASDDDEKGETASHIHSSFSHVIGGRVAGCRLLPQWAAEETVSALRDEEGLPARTGGGVLVLDSVSSFSYPTSSALGGPPSFMSSHPAATSSLTTTAAAPPSMVGHPQFSSGGGGNQNYRGLDPERFYDSGSEDESDYSGTSATETDSSSADQALEADLPASAGPDNGNMPGIDGASKGGASLADLLASASVDDTGRSTQYLFDSLDQIATAVAVSGVARKQSFVLDSAGNGSRKVIESWNGHGLELTVAFTRDGRVEDETPVLLTVSAEDKTCPGEVTVKSEEVSFGDNDSNQKVVTFGDGSQRVELHASCLFKGRTAPAVVYLFAGGQKLGVGEIRPTAGQVVRPRRMLSYSDFESKERTLQRAMFGSSTDFSIPPLPGTLASGENLIELAISHARQRVTDSTYLSEVLNRAAAAAVVKQEEAPDNCLCFAGLLSDPEAAGEGLEEQGKDVLVRLRVSKGASSVSLSIWVGCENVLFSNTLGQILKRATVSTWT